MTIVKVLRGQPFMLYILLILVLVVSIAFTVRTTKYNRRHVPRNSFFDTISGIIMLPSFVLLMVLCALLGVAGVSFAGLDGLYRSVVKMNFRKQSKRPPAEITSWRQLKRLPVGRKYRLHAIINNTSSIVRDGFVYIEWEDQGRQRPQNDFQKPWKIGIVLDDEIIDFKAPRIGRYRALKWSFNLQSENDPTDLNSTRVFRGLKPFDYVVLEGQVRLRKAKQPRRVIEEIYTVSAKSDWFDLPLSADEK